MELSLFIESLLTHGAVQVTGNITALGPEDLEAAKGLLQQYHKRDSLDMPGIAPAFDAGAGLWAAQYVYRAIQLVMLRNLGTEAITEHLAPYEGVLTPPVIYSADLCFRHLPSLLSLAKGLAPEDPLVLHLKETLRSWPYSSAAMDLADEAADVSVIFSDVSLRLAYVDRIIVSGNIKKAGREPVQAQVKEALGDHAALLWPEFIVSNNP
jgi:hypothetical protein